MVKEVLQAKLEQDDSLASVLHSHLLKIFVALNKDKHMGGSVIAVLNEDQYKSVYNLPHEIMLRVDILYWKYKPPMENIPALLIRTCRGPERAFHASANLTTESNERRSTSMTL